MSLTQNQEGRDWCTQMHVGWAFDRTIRVDPSWLEAVVLRASAVRVVCFVMHDQLVVHEVEAVGLRLVGVQDHLAHWHTEERGQGLASATSGWIQIRSQNRDTTSSTHRCTLSKTEPAAF